MIPPAETVFTVCGLTFQQLQNAKDEVTFDEARDSCHCETCILVDWTHDYKEDSPGESQHSKTRHS